ncbi:MAG TPA: serine hydrolase, partial [Orrella sp.]
MSFWTTSTRLLMLVVLTVTLPWQAVAQTTVATGSNMDASATAIATVPTVDVSEVSSISKPVIAARAWILIDAVTGQTIAAQNPQQTVEPASLTKIMTVYLTFDALKENRITRDQQVVVSEKAWKTPGSRMFIEPRKEVTVDEIIQGIVVQSGNDASVAIAETLAGTEEAFAQRMTEKALELGMTDTTFKNS